MRTTGLDWAEWIRPLVEWRLDRSGRRGTGATLSPTGTVFRPSARVAWRLHLPPERACGLASAPSARARVWAGVCTFTDPSPFGRGRRVRASLGVVQDIGDTERTGHR